MRRFGLLGAAVALFFASDQVSGQSTESCVQVSDATYTYSCPCDATSATFAFSIEGETSVAANTVNLAVVIDGSGSIYNAQWFQDEKDFAKSAVASFAGRNLFDNGGTASYVQFTTAVVTAGTHTSKSDFNDFVDADKQGMGGTDIGAGIAKARELLNATPSTAAFMIVVTDGNGGNVQTESDGARAEGTTVFAVGVGASVSASTLLAIGGDSSNVFDIDDFDALDSALQEILDSSSNGVACPSTGAVVTVDFNAVVTSVTSPAGATISGTEVTFSVADLESSPMDFEVVLETCDQDDGTDIVASASYVDDQNNTPDLSTVLNAGTISECAACPDGVDVCDDPHMQGLRGQKIDWSGVDGGWYCLVKDDEFDIHVNVRLTAPLPQEFPNRQLITGMSVMSQGHSFVIEVNNPYAIDTEGCPNDMSVCLADGGLHIVVDGEETDALLRPTRVKSVAGGIKVSASNLPVECRQFGGDRIWARMYEEMLQGSRQLVSERFEDWVMKYGTMAAPDWCARYIAERGLDNVQSTHTVFKIETRTVDVRLEVGVGYQIRGELDWDGRVLPDLEFWQMDVGLNGLSLEHESMSGILGGTARPVYDEDGRKVMKGHGAFRGTVEDYRVAAAAGTDFAQLHTTDL